MAGPCGTSKLREIGVWSMKTSWGRPRVVLQNYQNIGNFQGFHGILSHDT